MDINDPRYRLTVLNQANPSIRIATQPAPKQSIQISAPQQTPNIVVPNAPRDPISVPSSQPTNSWNTPEPVKSGGFGGFFKSAAHVVSEPFKPFAAGIARLLPGGQADIKANENLSTQLDSNQQTYNNLFKQGKINKDQYAKLTNSNAGGYSDVSKEAQRIADTADRSQVLGSAAMVPLSIFAPGGSLIRNVGAGAGFGALNELASQKDPTLKGGAIQTVAGAATGGVLDRFGAAGSKLLSKVSGKGGDVISKIVAETNPSKLVKKFGIPEEAAGFLANETNPETVKLVLDEMTQSGVPIKGWWEAPSKPSDPNAPAPTDLAPGMFDASNPPLSYLPPGVHAPGGVDPVPVIAEKAKGFKNAQEFDTYVRGLEGEERVMAANALNGKSPEEFYNTVTSPKALIPEKATPPTEVKGAGFTMTPNTNQAAVDAGKRLAQIDKKLHDVNVGKGAMTGEEARALTQEKQNIIDNLSNTGTKDAAAKIEQTAAEVTPTNDTLQPAAHAPAPAPEQAQSGTSGAAPKGDIPQDAKTMFPGLDDTQAAAVQKVMDSLDPAKAAYDTAVKARKVETATRFARADQNFAQAGGGSEGFYAKFKALGGKKTASEWAGADLTKAEGDALHNLVQSSDLMSGEKFNTQAAIEKVWGKNPQKPADHDINYIRRFFNDKLGDGMGDQLATAMQEAAQTKMGWKDAVVAIAGLPKTLMATFDFSAPRQAGALAARHPVMFLQEYGKSFKAAFNPKYYDEYMKSMADDPAWSVISDDMGVNLPGVGGKAEERYANAQAAEKIPLYGKTVVQGSQRSYNTLLTGLRFRAAKVPMDAAGGVEQYVKAMDSLYGDGAKEAKAVWGETINTLAGRGGAKGGQLEQHMSTASKALFSPRLWAANIQRLNPVWYAKLYKSNPAAAKEAMQAQGAFMAMVGTTLYLASKAPGVDVGTDMRSADFGKIRIGNTRLDIMGGQQQNIVQLWRQKTGEKVNSQTGDVSKLGETYGAKNRFDLFVDMLVSKSNPLINYATQVAKSSDNADSSNPLNRVDQYGQPMNLAASTGKLAVPLNIQGVKDTTSDTGSLAKGVAMNLPGFFGAGVNTYGTTKTKDQGQPNAQGQPTYKGKITPDMVTDNSGQAILDDKGKTIKVKYPTGASEREKQAIMNNARDQAYNKVAIAKLSADDKSLYNIGNKDKTMLSPDEVKKYSQVKKWVESYGKAPTVPDGATSDFAKAFYQKYNTMTPTDQKYWVEKGTPDATTTELTKQLNAQRSKGLSEYKPSNALAKAYAEYEKDLNTHPEYTEVDKRNKSKAFQTHAYKLNYNQNQRDVFQEGSSSDVRTLLSNGKISKEDLAHAIQMDNELYNSGLTGSLKFSKKFRSEFGFGLPSSYASGGGSGSGSGGSSSSPNAHLTSYLPGFSTGNNSAGGTKPGFSAKSRNTPSPTNVSTPFIPGIRLNTGTAVSRTPQRVNIKL